MTALRDSGPSGSHIPPRARLSEVDELEVTVEKLVAGGDGIARFEGLPIFVPRSAPGDRLRVRLTERRVEYGRAEIVEILQPGPGRREPPCPHFAECGGCDLQHLEDGVQLTLKVAAARETLERIGGITWPDKVEVLSGEAWGYRHRAQLRLERGGEGRGVGYFARRSHRLVPVNSCPILVPQLEDLLAPIRDSPVEGRPERLDVLAGDGGVTVSPPVRGLPQGEVEVAVGAASYRLDARCFFQSHRGLLPTLVERAVGGWKGDRAYDLYAGVGLFSVALARNYDAVVAVEGDRVASRFGRKNARLGGCAGLEVVHQAVESWVGGMPDGVERVLVDPPRGGLSHRVLRALGARAPRRFTYVSCHVATLARDLQRLGGRFELESLTLLDMFPQTGHIEVIAQLVSNVQRRSGG